MKKNLILTFIFLISVVSYVKDVSSSVYIRPITLLFSRLLLPFYQAKADFQDYIQQKLKTYVFLVNVQRNNIELSKKIQELELYKSMYESCEISLSKISNDLGIKDYTKQNYTIVNARIIGYDLKGRDEYILINKGKDENLDEGFLVFSNQNLVGVVEKVLPMSSVVLTVHSERFTISSTLMDYSKNYIYKGGWKDGELLYVANEDSINLGAYVITRGTKEQFPAFIIGRVSKVEKVKGEFFKKVYVKPIVDIRKLEYVSVLSSKP